jgi:hypothetical protein
MRKSSRNGLWAQEAEIFETVQSKSLKEAEIGTLYSFASSQMEAYAQPVAEQKQRIGRAGQGLGARRRESANGVNGPSPFRARIRNELLKLNRFTAHLDNDGDFDGQTSVVPDQYRVSRYHNRRPEDYADPRIPTLEY